MAFIKNLIDAEKSYRKGNRSEALESLHDFLSRCQVSIDLLPYAQFALELSALLKAEGNLPPTVGGKDTTSVKAYMGWPNVRAKARKFHADCIELARSAVDAEIAKLPTSLDPDEKKLLAWYRVQKEKIVCHGMLLMLSNGKLQLPPIFYQGGGDGLCKPANFWPRRN